MNLGKTPDTRVERRVHRLACTRLELPTRGQRCALDRQETADAAIRLSNRRSVRWKQHRIDVSFSASSGEAVPVDVYLPVLLKPCRCTFWRLPKSKYSKLSEDNRHAPQRHIDQH